MKISDLKIRARIFIAVIIPVIGMLIFSGYVTIKGYHALGEVKKEEFLMRGASASSLFVHEMQKERGLSAGYMSSEGASSIRQKLQAQRDETDKAAESLKREFDSLDLSLFGKKGANIQEEIKVFHDKLDRLAAVRNEIFDLSANREAALGFYSASIENLLAFVAQTASLSTDAAVMSD